MGNINGRVTGLNKTTFDALEKVNVSTNRTGVLSADAAKELSQAILKDGKIDTAEEDLLIELTQDKSRLVSVSSADSAPNQVTFGTAKGNAKNILLETLAPRKKIEEMIDNGAQGFKDLTKVYSRSPADAKRVVDILVSKAGKAWDASSLGNRYEPLRTFIATAYSGVNALEGQANTDGRNMLHEALKQVDQNVGDRIPDVFYNWVRPGGVI